MLFQSWTIFDTRFKLTNFCFNAITRINESEIFYVLKEYEIRISSHMRFKFLIGNFLW